MAEICINDNNVQDFLNDPSVSEFRARGAKPRDWTIAPVGGHRAAPEFPDELLLDDKTINERIAELAAKKAMLSDVRNVMGPDGGRIPSLDQGHYGYCWAHSSTGGIHIIRAINGQPYVPLSAFAVAAIIKNYRDEGGWGHESLDFIAATGVPSQALWPQGQVKRSLDTPEMRANAALHKCTEWYDLSDDPDKAAHQMASIILGLGSPVVTDFNWWGHSVLTLDIVSWNPLKTRILNSWSDSWSENGTGLLEGNKAKPNGAVSPRVTGLATV